VRPYRRLGGCLLATALTVGSAYAVPAAAAPISTLAQAAATTAQAGGPRIITLITGDRLQVSADGSTVTPLPSPGREGVTFFTDRIGGHLSVLPADALPLVNSGKVDRQLFDITTLLEFGYDDTRADLPLIVTYANGDAGEKKLRTTVAAADAEVSHDLETTNSLAVAQDKTQAAELWDGLTSVAPATKARSLRGEISKVVLDGKLDVLLDTSVPQVGAPAAWAGGYTGKGATIGLIDTGVDATHPDLAGRVVAKDFTGTGLDDTVGHGTHVASTMAGNGAASSGRYKGVAPEATIYSAKACTESGCQISAISAAAVWLASDMNVKIVNMSLGGRDTPELDPTEQAITALSRFRGTLFVIAAGNNGPTSTVSSPATVEAALAVGSVNKKDVFSAAFSSPGPRLGDGVLKPEIVAPGERITAAKSAQMDDPDVPEGQYLTIDGTSMATPHVTAAAALLRQQHPDWTGPQIKATLMGAAHPVAGANVYQQGAGRLDIAKAITQTVTTTPPAVTLGQHREPSGDDVPVTRTVTYHNGGTAALTLDLTLDATGPGGAKAPDGMFTLGATSISVPAGGTAEVTVTGDTHPKSKVGVYGGSLVATSGGTVVNRTPVGLEKQTELADLVIHNIDRNGANTYRARVIVAGLDNDVAVSVPEIRPTPGLPAGSVKLSLPVGRYLVQTNSQIYVGLTSESAMLTAPEVVLTEATTLTMDARQAKPIAVTVTKPNAVAMGGFINITAEVGSGGFLANGIMGSTFDRIFSGKVGGGSEANINSHIFGHWAQKQADGTTLDSPWTVSGAWIRKGKILDGYAQTVTDGELATVKGTFAEEQPNSRLTKTVIPVWPGVDRDLYGISSELSLPGKRTDYYTTGDGVRWEAHVDNLVLGAFDWMPDAYGPTSYMFQPATRYEVGRTYREQWNRGVFGAALIDEDGFGPTGITRSLDTISINYALHGDDQGRPGSHSLDVNHVTVKQDGAVIEDRDGYGGWVRVKPGAADYEITSQTSRKAPASLSTAQTVTWTFRSGATPDETPVRMPVSVVRFFPELDQHNKAAAGDYDFIPYKVLRQVGAPAAAVTGFEMTVSYDGGRTWVKPVVQRFGDAGIALARRPAGAKSGFVSLHTRATMADGGTVEQTLLNAIGF
jgi:subtilisin family serine protease